MHTTIFSIILVFPYDVSKTTPLTLRLAIQELSVMELAVFPAIHTIKYFICQYFSSLLDLRNGIKLYNFLRKKKILKLETLQF